MPSSFVVRCGPQAVAWRLDDPAVAADLAARWTAHLTDQPPQLTLCLQALAAAERPAELWMTPVRITRTAALVDVRCGNIGWAHWERAATRMDGRYHPGLQPIVMEELCSVLARSLWADWAAEQGLVLLHACGIVRDGAIDIFAGPSGVGKSTLAGLAGDARVLHDDTLLLTLDAGRPVVWQAPWRAAAWTAQAGRAWPVGRLCLLERGGAPGAQPCAGQEALSWMLRRGLYSAIALDAAARRQQLAVLGELLDRRPGHRFSYRLGQDDPWTLLNSDSVAGAVPHAMDVSI